MHANNRPPSGSAPIVVSLIHEGQVRRSVLALKYAGREGEAAWMGRHLAALLRESGVTDATVTWVPTTPGRRRRRGFDHARLIAEHTARNLGTGCAALLRRLDSRAQTGTDRAHRLVPPRFVARRPRSRPGTVVVVDDVVTTGSTLRAAEAALVAAGHRAENVVCAAVAASP